MRDHIFVHIPATAGTSVREAIGSRRIVHDLARNHYQRDGVDWDRYFKFTVVRDPYDRAISICAKLHGCVMYDWLTPDAFRRIIASAVVRGVQPEQAINKLCVEHGKRPRGRWLSPAVFRRWVADGMPDTRIHNNPNAARMATPQREYLTSEDGDWLVDHVMRFERLADDLPILCDMLNIPRVSEFDNKNPSARDLGYGDYYDAETRERVEDHFRVDLEEWDYTFEGKNECLQLLNAMLS